MSCSKVGVLGLRNALVELGVDHVDFVKGAIEHVADRGACWFDLLGIVVV